MTHDTDAERFRWLEAQVARNHIRVYEHGTRVSDLRTAVDICRGMEAAEEIPGGAGGRIHSKLPQP